MKKIYLWPACLAVIYTASIIIIVSPISNSTIIPLPTPVPTVTFPDPSDSLSVVPTREVLTKIHNQSLNINFLYPSYLSVVENKTKIVLTNNLKVTFTTLKPNRVKVDNFKVTFSTITTPPKYDNTITRGKFIYFSQWLGFEGSGEQNYYLKTNEREWLKVSRQFYLDSDIDLSDREKIGYISNEKQIEIVDQILTSLTEYIPATGSAATPFPSKVNSKFICPKNNWVDCMPGPGPTKAQCDETFLQWATKSCPGFEGAAY